MITLHTLAIIDECKNKTQCKDWAAYYNRRAKPYRKKLTALLREAAKLKVKIGDLQTVVDALERKAEQYETNTSTSI